MFFSYCFKSDWPRDTLFFVLMTSSLVLFLACSYIFYQNQGFFSYEIVLIKKESNSFFDIVSGSTTMCFCDNNDVFSSCIAFSYIPDHI